MTIVDLIIRQSHTRFHHELITFDQYSMCMYKNILIALEGKPTDEAAVVHVTALALENGAHVTLLQVIQLAQTGGDGMRYLQLEPGAWAWRRKNEAKVQLAQLEVRLRAQGLEADTSIVLGERCEADEIVDFAAEAQADLIVMAADGRAWWRRLISGCIADGVQRKSGIPTLFVSDGSRRARIVARQQPLLDSPLAGFDHIHP